MKNKSRAKYNIKILHFSKNGKKGRLLKHGKLMDPEEKTIECLTEFGFDVETIIPSNMPGTANPDIVMLGTLWEVKSLTTCNGNTIKVHFRKAIKQSGGRGIFDIRYALRADSAEASIIELFETTRMMRRIMILKSLDGEVVILDLRK